MMPGTIRAHSEVQINDSCNQCCCFQWRRRKTVVQSPEVQQTSLKVEQSANDVLLRQVSDGPTVYDMRMELEKAKRDEEKYSRPHHMVSHMTLDVTKTEDVEFVQGYSVPSSTLIPQQEEEQPDLFASATVIDLDKK